MKSKIRLGLIVLVSLALLLSIGLTQLGTANDEQPIRKIVVFQTWFVNEAAQDELIDRAGGFKVKDLDLIGGMAVYLPNHAAAAALASRPEVLRVDDDVVVEALARGGIPGKPAPTQPAEVVPWGIDRIDADLVWGITTADPIKVAIIDTGIDLTHPDLSGNIKGGYNAIHPTKSPNDDNGHGTHVAGITAAIDNDIGVIGVGPNIDLYAVKVLSRTGSGYLSDVIEGLDWAVSNGMQVVNMSLGTNSDIQSFHDAVIRVNQAGITQVAAAGNNSGGSVTYPAAYSEVIAVSATDSADQIAYFSSAGPEVDLAAPGVSIYSTYKGSTYKTLSGTSMAAPHVTGTASLVLTVPIGAYDLDSDGLWDPNEVQNKLQATAIDLGIAGPDNLYGYGLVYAYSAVTL
jgi:subtilisin family serine protease